MNTQNFFPQQAPKHQSTFTLFCTFDYSRPYFGEHQKWTFRGDEFTEKIESQVEALTWHYYQLKQKEAINKAIIYCNKPTLLQAPEPIIKSWFRGKLLVDNSAFVRYNPNTDFEFSEGFKNLLIKWNLYQDESEVPKFNSYNSDCFFF